MKADAAPGTAPSRHNKGGFLKPRLSSNSWTPGRRLSPRGALTSDPPSGPWLSPETPRGGTRLEVARRKPPTWTTPFQSSASRQAAVCARLKCSDLPGEQSAGLALGKTAAPAAACEVWSCPPAHPLAAKASSAPRMPTTPARSERERARAPSAGRAASTLRVLPAAEPQNIWSTPVLEANWAVGPGGRERGGRKEVRVPR